MGRGGSEASSAVFGMCAFIWVVCSCFLLGFSFDTLEPNRMGLLYNENTCFLDTTTLYVAPTTLAIAVEAVLCSPIGSSCVAPLADQVQCRGG